MLTITAPTAYLQQPGLRKQAGEHTHQPYARELRILTSPRAWQAVNPELSHSLESAGISWQLEYLDGECTDDAINRLRENVVVQGAQGILAVGGGRVLDCAKAAADTLDNVVLINFATLAATCAAWSPFAIVYNASGGYHHGILVTKKPALLLVDSEVIAHTDVRYLKADIVDALAKWFELEPYQRQNPGRLGLDLKVSMAPQALEVYAQWGSAAVIANQNQLVPPALENVIEANILLAGLANRVHDDLPTPGVAHEIHNRLTHEPELHDLLHGEKVGYCLLIQSLLERGQQPDERLMSLLRQYESPLTPSALTGDVAARFRQIAREIFFPSVSLTHLPFAITVEKLEQALVATIEAT